jgi:hypothetical protein
MNISKNKLNVRRNNDVSARKKERSKKANKRLRFLKVEKEYIYRK